MSDQPSTRIPSDDARVERVGAIGYWLLSGLVTGPDPVAANELVAACADDSPRALDAHDPGPRLRRAFEKLREEVVAAGPEELLEQADIVLSTLLSPELPPYSTRYGEGASFREQNELADIKGFYKAFGIDVAPERHERPDHLALELEFLSFLSMRFVRALDDGAASAPGGIEIIVDARRRFLRDYVGPFLFAVAEGLARSAPPIYLAWAEVLRELLALDFQRLSINPPQPVKARYPEAFAEFGPMPCLGDQLA